MISKVVLGLASCGNVCKGCDSSAWPAVAASSSTSSTTAATSSSNSTMVKTFQAYLPQCHRTYSCIHCRAHLANHDELISKSFQGSQGRAYLFNSVVNVGCGPAEERVLLTGLHAVADIYCECCKTTLGWKYEHAFESSQKYKEGKFIIELAHMIKENGWD
ncbi:protein yippee-like 2 isoform X1 [Tenebrio molitor]|uniref:protein yippee-like 2 isoform X1 n=1 Tax=Tenebrio molitor TaxID=7067 RepID=UPI0036248F49